MKKLLIALGLAAVAFLFVPIIPAQTGPTKTSIFQAYVLPGGAKGDLLYVNSTSGDFVRLPIGATDSRFTVAGGVPVWQSPTPTPTNTPTATVTNTPTNTPTPANTPTPTTAPCTTQKIASAAGTGSAATLTFSSIPATYRDLEIVLVARDTKAAAADSTFIKFNGDNTASNYTGGVYILGTGSAASSGTNSAATNLGNYILTHPGASATANYTTAATIHINNYAGTGSFKKVYEIGGESCCSGASERYMHNTFTWKNTAAITQIDLTTDGTAYATSTLATLYGLGCP